MNRDEILERSRKEKKDEGIEFAMNRGRRIGTVGISAVFIILATINIWKGINNYALFAVFWTYAGLESIGKYSITKGRLLLITSICTTLAGLLYFVCYIHYVMG